MEEPARAGGSTTPSSPNRTKTTRIIDQESPVVDQGSINSGPTAACGWTHMRAVLGDEFVPADDPSGAGECPRCAALVADGKGFRDPPDPYGFRSPFCDAYLRLRVDGNVSVKDCTLRDFHDGPHRARDGAEWEVGVDDYVPSPDEVGCRITKAS